MCYVKASEATPGLNGLQTLLTISSAHNTQGTMKTIRLHLIMVLLVFAAKIHATPEIDSLQQILPATTDTTRVNILNRLSQLHWYSDPESSLSYAREALVSAQSINFEPGISSAFRNLGVANDVMGNYDEALTWYQKALAIVRTSGDEASEGAVLNNVGLAYFNQGEVTQATEHYLMALPILERTGPPARLASVLNNLGLVYHKMNRQNESLEYHRRAYEIRKQISDKHGTAASLHNIGFCYDSMDNTDSALVYYRQSEAIKSEGNDLYGLATTLNNIGNIYQRLGNLREAEKYFLRVLDLRTRLNDLSGLASAHYNLSLIYRNNGRLEESLREAYKALGYATKSGAQVREYTIYGGLMSIYKSMGNYEKALEYYEKYADLKHSLFSLERSNQVAELQEKYEAEKKEKEIAFLNYENEMKSIQMEKQRSQNRFIIFSLYILLILLGLVALFLHFRYRYKHKLQLENERTIQQQKGFKAVLEAEENERMRIARELHDGLGQILSTTKLQLYALEEHLADETRQSLETPLSMIDEAVNEVRSISHNMMPAALMRLGLVSALNEMARKINLANKIEVVIKAAQFEPRPGFSAEIGIYRIVQEILNNALKHSNASRITVTLLREDRNINLSIEDNGIGLENEKVETSSGIGWLSINTRVNMLNGSISINSLKGLGTVVNVKLVA